MTQRVELQKRLAGIAELAAGLKGHVVLVVDTQDKESLEDSAAQLQGHLEALNKQRLVAAMKVAAHLHNHELTREQLRAFAEANGFKPHTGSLLHSAIGYLNNYERKAYVGNFCGDLTVDQLKEAPGAGKQVVKLFEAAITFLDGRNNHVPDDWAPPGPRY